MEQLQQIKEKENIQQNNVQHNKDVEQRLAQKDAQIVLKDQELKENLKKHLSFTCLSYL